MSIFRNQNLIYSFMQWPTEYRILPNIRPKLRFGSVGKICADTESFSFFNKIINCKKIS